MRLLLHRADPIKQFKPHIQIKSCPWGFGVLGFWGFRFLQVIPGSKVVLPDPSGSGQTRVDLDRLKQTRMDPDGPGRARTDPDGPGQF